MPHPKKINQSDKSALKGIFMHNKKHVNLSDLSEYFTNAALDIDDAVLSRMLRSVSDHLAHASKTLNEIESSFEYESY